jgi:predicted nucleotidyltransferase
MSTLPNSRNTDLTALCQRYGVKRLELFGSANTPAFDPQHSDFDFLVEFAPDNQQDLFHRYFGLNEDLERLFGRKVDLVMVGAMKNPYFMDSVDRTRRLVYAA